MIGIVAESITVEHVADEQCQRNGSRGQRSGNRESRRSAPFTLDRGGPNEVVDETCAGLGISPWPSSCLSNSSNCQ